MDIDQLDQELELLHRFLLLAPRPLARQRGPWRSPASGRATCRAPEVRHANPGLESQESRSPLLIWASSSGKEGGSLRALRCLRRSNECNPQDPQTAYGLAFAA